MKKRLFTSIFALIMLSLPFGSSYASYYAWQFLNVEIVSVDAPGIYDNQYTKYIVKVTLLVRKLGRGGGHSKNHCQDFLNQKKEAKLLVKNLADVKKLVVGAKLEVKYRYEDGLTVDRVTGQQMVVSGQSWEFIRFI